MKANYFSYYLYLGIYCASWSIETLSIQPGEFPFGAMIVAEACNIGDLYAHASKMARYYIRRPGIRRQHLTLSSTDIEFGLQEKNK
jgi:hypothetical protein